jgi:hypothetical protein
MPLHDDDDYDDRPASRRRRPDEDEEDGRDDRRRRRYEDDEDGYDLRQRELPHSGVGIASCVLALLAVLIGAFAMALAADVGFDDIEAAIDAGEPQAMLAALLVIGAGFLSLVGVALAIAGLLQRDRNKLFAILGLCLNGLFFLCGFGLMLIGMLTD